MNFLKNLPGTNELIFESDYRNEELYIRIVQIFLDKRLRYPQMAFIIWTLSPSSPILRAVSTLDNVSSPIICPKI